MLLFTLLVTAIISLLTGSVYYFAKLERKQVFEKRLRSRAVYNMQLYSLMGDSAFGFMHRIDTASTVGTIASRSIGIYTDEGKVLYLFDMPNRRHLTITPEQLEAARTKGEIHFSLDNLEAVAIHRHAGKKDFVVVVAGHDDDGLERVETLNKILVISLILGVLLTATVSFLFAQQLLRPIALIIREVKEISSFDLSHRIRAGTGQDEMSQLANTFNDLLGRLQEAFAIQRRFISNASHELSTPLTSISSQLQVTLQKTRNVEEYQKVLHSIQEDVEQMSRLTKSLLEIAKTGYEGGIELNEVRIDEIMFKVVSDVKKLNAAYQVELEFGEFPDDEKSCLAYGNADLLYSALKNITENGCKYSPDKRTSVYLHFHNRQVLIEIRNRGDVIAEEEIENIFHPFYRASTAGETKGFGLGLALSKRIIRLHKGNIEVKSDVVTGTTFTIQLPSLSSYYPQ